MPGNRILVVGGLNYDFVLSADRIARAGETVVGHDFATSYGGKGGNQAVAAARLLAEEGRVAMVARVGADWLGEELVQALRQDGVDCSGVRIDRGAPTGVAAIMQDAKGENTVTAVYGANARCDTQQVADAVERLDNAAALLLQLEIPWGVSQACAEAARRHGVPVILDPAPVINIPRTAFAGIDILTPNQGEAERWSGVTVNSPASAMRAAAHIRDNGVGCVIVTLGARGVVVDCDELQGHFPAPEVGAVSTLAAGDAFAGALAAGLAEGLDLRPAIDRAQAAAALAVTRHGAQASMPSREDVVRLMAK